MKSWTRTLNLADAHTLLALAEPGLERFVWESRCHEALAERKLVRARETGLIRLVRETFLAFDEDSTIIENLFLRLYQNPGTSALGQQDLVRLAWALSNPVTKLAVGRLVLPALSRDGQAITLAAIDAFVADVVETKAPDALRKTRTTLLSALEGIGVVETKGTGRHRQVKATLAEPHPIVFTYLLLSDLAERGGDTLEVVEALGSNLATRTVPCHVGHAYECLGWALKNGLLIAINNDEIGVESA
jgi:hypothetical protein